jgi:hypothetical protein
MPNLIPHGPTHDWAGGDPEPRIWAPDRRVFEYDDFFGYFQVSGGSPQGKLGWYLNGSGSNAIVCGSLYGCNKVDRASGVMDWSLTSGGALEMGFGNLASLTGQPVLQAGLGIYTQEWRFAIGPSWINKVSDMLLFFGLGNNISGNGTAGYSGFGGEVMVMVTYPANAMPNWYAYLQSMTQPSAALAHTQTDFGAGLQPDPIRFHKYKMVTNVDWTSVQFYIDGVAIGSPLAANIPIGQVAPVFYASQAEGAVQHIYLDYFWHDYQYAR